MENREIIRTIRNVGRGGYHALILWWKIEDRSGIIKSVNYLMNNTGIFNYFLVVFCTCCCRHVFEGTKEWKAYM